MEKEFSHPWFIWKEKHLVAHSLNQCVCCLQPFIICAWYPYLPNMSFIHYSCESTCTYLIALVCWWPRTIFLAHFDHCEFTFYPTCHSFTILVKVHISHSPCLLVAKNHISCTFWSLWIHILSCLCTSNENSIFHSCVSEVSSVFISQFISVCMSFLSHFHSLKMIIRHSININMCAMRWIVWYRTLTSWEIRQVREMPIHQEGVCLTFEVGWISYLYYYFYHLKCKLRLAYFVMRNEVFFHLILEG